MAKLIDYRRWRAIGALVLLTSVVSFAKPNDKGKKGCSPHDNCLQVPDGGSAAAYLLIAGSSCLGAMAIRTRLKKRVS
jgi:hypothetical protein